MELAREAYQLAGDPPSIDYSRRIDPTYRDDLSRMPRSYLLRMSLDAKMALEYVLKRTPTQRADILKEWIKTESEYYRHNLTRDAQFFLKIDVYRLIQAMKGVRNEK